MLVEFKMIHLLKVIESFSYFIILLPFQSLETLDNGKPYNIAYAVDVPKCIKWLRYVCRIHYGKGREIFILTIITENDNLHQTL